MLGAMLDVVCFQNHVPLAGQQVRVRILVDRLEKLAQKMSKTEFLFGEGRNDAEKEKDKREKYERIKFIYIVPRNNSQKSKKYRYTKEREKILKDHRPKEPIECNRPLDPAYTGPPVVIFEAGLNVTTVAVPDYEVENEEENINLPHSTNSIMCSCCNVTNRFETNVEENFEEDDLEPWKNPQSSRKRKKNNKKTVPLIPILLNIDHIFVEKK